MPKVVLIALAILAFTAPALAQPLIGPSRSASPGGASAATVTGSIRAEGGVDYVLVVRADQTLKVSMRTANASARFNIIAPGLDEPLFNGSNARDYAGKTPVAGAYRIIVYMTETAAMRDETADYALTIGVTG